MEICQTSSHQTILAIIIVLKYSYKESNSFTVNSTVSTTKASYLNYNTIINFYKHVISDAVFHFLGELYLLDPPDTLCRAREAGNKTNMDI